MYHCLPVIATASTTFIANKTKRSSQLFEIALWHIVRWIPCRVLDIVNPSALVAVPLGSNNSDIVPERRAFTRSHLDFLILRISRFDLDSVSMSISYPVHSAYTSGRFLPVDDTSVLRASTHFYCFLRLVSASLSRLLRPQRLTCFDIVAETLFSASMVVHNCERS